MARGAVGGRSESDALTQALSAPRPHVFAPLPGGLRRSAKNGVGTSAVVYRRAVGDGSWGGTQPLGECISALRPSLRLQLGGKRNTVQYSVNNCGIEGCVAFLRGGWNPIVNIATARFHGRSIVADSLAEGHTQRSLGQRPRTVDRQIIIGWLKANLTIAHGMDFGEIQRIAAK